MPDLDNLPAELRAWTKNHDAHVRAAVELLIQHDHWLWDEGFTSRCVFGNDGIACIDFTAVKRYHEEGMSEGLPCSTSEAAMLLVIADIGSGRWQIDTMDGRNRQRVADAVMRAAGLAPMPDDDRIAVTLAGIEERARASADDKQDGVALWIGALGASQEDVPSLVAAVERVLKLADEAKATGTTVCDCLKCSAARQNGFTGIHRLQPYMWNLDPAKVRGAIAAELAKGEAGDGR